jgi:adenylate kinase family enzyme
MKRRFRVYKESISDLIGYYKDNNVLLELDGTLPIDMVHRSILSHLNPLDYSVIVPIIKSTA